MRSARLSVHARFSALRPTLPRGVARLAGCAPPSHNGRCERVARKVEPEPADDGAPLHACEHPGCAEAGLFRAPRDRTLRQFLWFCLPHVRAYNRAWDYYKGMGPTEIEAHLRDDTAWQRPTWPLGRLGGAGRFDPEILRDPLGVLRDARRRGAPARRARRTSRRPNCAPRSTCWASPGRSTRSNCAPATRNWRSATTPMPMAATAPPRSG